MSDGGRLEGIGVSPDIPVGPTPRDFAGKVGSVLAYATELMGSAITVENAGQLNFLIPKTEDVSDKDDEEKPDQ